MSNYQSGFVGIWTDEHKLVKAAQKTREAGFDNFEAISPFPLHGIDEAMGIPRSFIPWVTFGMGLAGLAFGTWFTWWTSAVDWPVIVGGKPSWSLAAFIPVIFELVILFAALGSVAALIYLCGLPNFKPAIIDPDLTCHKFALFVPNNAPGYDSQKLRGIFEQNGAIETKEAEF